GNLSSNRAAVRVTECPTYGGVSLGARRYMGMCRRSQRWVRSWGRLVEEGGREMTPSKKDVLATLQTELAFVERGGYRAPKQTAWRLQFIFEDSPTCLNSRNLGERHPCSQCALIDFFPNGHKQRNFLCRYIPLDDSAHTLDLLYRTATEEEAHAMVANWLGK